MDILKGEPPQETGHRGQEPGDDVNYGLCIEGGHRHVNMEETA